MTFKDLLDREVVVEIGGGEGNLIGAADAIEIDEDDDEDLFKAVRCRSGLIRIVAEGDVLQELMPTTPLERPVTVTRDGECIFYGYLQMATYSQTYEAAVHEVEIPIVCPLTVAEGLYIDATSGGAVTIRQILDEIEEKIMGEEKANLREEWPEGTNSLTATVMREAFRELGDEEDEESSGGWYPQTLREVLETIARYWGWQVSMRGKRLRFLQLDRKSRADMEEGDLLLIRGQRENWLMGRKRVIVSSTQGNQETTALKMDLEEAYQQTGKATTAYMREDESTVRVCEEASYRATGNIAFNWSGWNTADCVVASLDHWEKDSMKRGFWGARIENITTDKYLNKAGEMSLILAEAGTPGSGQTPIAKIRTKNFTVCSRMPACLVLQMSVSAMEEVKDAFTSDLAGTFQFTLRWGHLWYLNRSPGVYGWGSGEGGLEVTMNWAEFRDGQLVLRVPFVEGQPDSTNFRGNLTGLYIPLDSYTRQFSGELEMEIYAWNTLGGGGRFIRALKIDSIELKLVTREYFGPAPKAPKVRWSENLGNGYPNEYEVSNGLCTPVKDAVGSRLVMPMNWDEVSEPTWNGETKIAEKAMLERLKRQFVRSRRTMKLTALSASGVEPGTTIRGRDGRLYVVLSVSENVGGAEAEIVAEEIITE